MSQQIEDLSAVCPTLILNPPLACSLDVADLILNLVNDTEPFLSEENKINAQTSGHKFSLIAFLQKQEKFDHFVSGSHTSYIKVFSPLSQEAPIPRSLFYSLQNQDPQVCNVYSEQTFSFVTANSKEMSLNKPAHYTVLHKIRLPPSMLVSILLINLFFFLFFSLFFFLFYYYLLNKFKTRWPNNRLANYIMNVEITIIIVCVFFNNSL